jgi:uncharacterized protein YjbJ (UPF0337 family)
MNEPSISDPLPIVPSEPTRSEEFAKTATAAKMSGTYHETTGYFKRKLGQLIDDPLLEDSGQNQQLLGKIHRFVGILRGIREDVSSELNSKRIESQAICRKHGGRLLDVASDFLEDMKKTLLK